MKSPSLGEAGHTDFLFFFFLTSDSAWEEEVPAIAWERNLNIEKKIPKGRVGTTISV